MWLSMVASIVSPLLAMKALLSEDPLIKNYGTLEIINLTNTPSYLKNLLKYKNSVGLGRILEIL